VSDKFVWQNIGLFPASQETFYSAYGPPFSTAELYVMSALENIFDIALLQSIVDETNSYTRQEISRSLNPGFGTLYVDGHCTEAYA
jgi:hypothetical protein